MPPTMPPIAAPESPVEWEMTAVVLGAEDADTVDVAKVIAEGGNVFVVAGITSVVRLDTEMVLAEAVDVAPATRIVPGVTYSFTVTTEDTVVVTTSLLPAALELFGERLPLTKTTSTAAYLVD